MMQEFDRLAGERYRELAPGQKIVNELHPEYKGRYAGCGADPLSMDFFGNHEYFNDSEADVFVSASGGRAPSGEPTSPRLGRDLIELGPEDEWLHAVSYVEVWPEDERIDKHTM